MVNVVLSVTEKQLLDELSAKLHIRNLDDWYRVSLQHIHDNAPMNFRHRYFALSLSILLFIEM